MVSIQKIQSIDSRVNFKSDFSTPSEDKKPEKKGLKPLAVLSMLAIAGTATFAAVKYNKAVKLANLKKEASKRLAENTVITPEREEYLKELVINRTMIDPVENLKKRSKVRHAKLEEMYNNLAWPKTREQVIYEHQQEVLRQV